MTVTDFLIGLANLTKASGDLLLAETIRDYATIALQHEHDYLANTPEPPLKTRTAAK